MFVFISSFSLWIAFILFLLFSVICLSSSSSSLSLLLLALLCCYFFVVLLLLFSNFILLCSVFIFTKLLACYEFNEQNSAIVRVFYRYFSRSLSPFVSLFVAHLHELIIVFGWHVLRAQHNAIEKKYDPFGWFRSFFCHSVFISLEQKFKWTTPKPVGNEKFNIYVVRWFIRAFKQQQHQHKVGNSIMPTVKCAIYHFEKSKAFNCFMDTLVVWVHVHFNGQRQ